MLLKKMPICLWPQGAIPAGGDDWDIKSPPPHPFALSSLYGRGVWWEGR